MMAVLARIILLAASAAAFVARPSLAPVGARARSVAPQQFVRSRAPVALPSRCVAAPILAGPRARPPPPAPTATRKTTVAARAETSP